MNTDHIEDVRGMVPVYQIRPDRENWIDCTEKYYAEWKGDKRTLYTQPANCPRCAELSESLNNRAREQAQKTVNNEVSLDKLATLEAEKEEIKQAIRWAPSSAHWSNVLIKLCGEDSRDGINALEKQLREAQATISQQAERIKELEAEKADEIVKASSTLEVK